MYFEITPSVKLVTQHFALPISAVLTCSALVPCCVTFRLVPIALWCFRCACLWWLLALGPAGAGWAVPPAQLFVVSKGAVSEPDWLGWAQPGAFPSAWG